MSHLDARIGFADAMTKLCWDRVGHASLTDAPQEIDLIGAVMDAWMLQPNWERGVTTNENVTLQAVADQIDHVCQLAGNCRHAAIGTDLDGGYGIEQTPRDLDTVADVQKIPDLLRPKGYTEPDITAIMHGNWLRLLERGLPSDRL